VVRRRFPRQGPAGKWEGQEEAARPGSVETAPFRQLASPGGSGFVVLTMALWVVAYLGVMVSHGVRVNI